MGGSKEYKNVLGYSATGELVGFAASRCASLAKRGTILWGAKTGSGDGGQGQDGSKRDTILWGAKTGSGDGGQGQGGTRRGKRTVLWGANVPERPGKHHEGPAGSEQDTKRTILWGAKTGNGDDGQGQGGSERDTILWGAKTGNGDDGRTGS